MLQRIREWLTVALVFLLPLHALWVTVLTKLIAGPGHAPLTALALWKEGVLGIILVIALTEGVKQRTSGKWKVESGKRLNIDVLDTLIIASILLGVLVTATRYPLPATYSLSRFLYGFKYDFLPLCAFLVLRRVSWSGEGLRRICMALLAAGVIVALYGIITRNFPLPFFTALGYSDLHSLYVAGGPLAPFQQIEGTMIRRLQSTMSGPNQLGLWLLIPLALVLERMRHRRGLLVRSFAGLLVCLAIFLTYSRAAWIAAFVVVCVIVLPMLLRRARSSTAVRLSLLSAVVLLVALGITATRLVPDLLLRNQSFVGHLTKPLEAVRIMVNNPFGLGLGSAGPASNALSDTCVFLPIGSDYSWANDRTDLCVFTGDTQRMPVSRVCSCPLLTENWYLQVGVEMGFVGCALFVALIALVLRRLGMENGKWKMENDSSQFSILHFQYSICLAFLGLSIAALFLHAFEDSAVAYTVWMIAGISLGSRSGKQ